MRYDADNVKSKFTDQEVWSLMGILLLIVLVVAVSFRGACVDDASTKRAVEKQGYTEVKLHDKGIFAVGLRGCESTDAAKYAAKAKNAAGKDVDLVVCVGWPFKGTTIRTE